MQQTPTFAAAARAPTAKLLQAPWLRPREVADLLGVGRATVHRLVQRGELAAHRVGLSIRITPVDLAAFRRRAGRAGPR